MAKSKKTAKKEEVKVEEVKVEETKAEETVEKTVDEEVGDLVKETEDTVTDETKVEEASDEVVETVDEELKDESVKEIVETKTEDYVVTQEDLDANPELETNDIKVGDTIQVPIEETIDEDSAKVDSGIVEGDENGTKVEGNEHPVSGKKHDCMGEGLVKSISVSGKRMTLCKVCGNRF